MGMETEETVGVAAMVATEGASAATEEEDSGVTEEQEEEGIYTWVRVAVLSVYADVFAA